MSTDWKSWKRQGMSKYWKKREIDKKGSESGNSIINAGLQSENSGFKNNIFEKVWKSSSSLLNDVNVLCLKEQ